MKKVCLGLLFNVMLVGCGSDLRREGEVVPPAPPRDPFVDYLQGYWVGEVGRPIPQLAFTGNRFVSYERFERQGNFVKIEAVGGTFVVERGLLTLSYETSTCARAPSTPGVTRIALHREPGEENAVTLGNTSWDRVRFPGPDDPVTLRLGCFASETSSEFRERELHPIGSAEN